MNKSLVTGLVIGAASRNRRRRDGGLQDPAWARVRAGRRRQAGHEDRSHAASAVPRRADRAESPTKDSHQITGSVLGAVVGGVLGHQVGGGSGKKIATVAGAAAGGYAGNRVQKNMQDRNTITTTEQRCETVYDSHEEHLGFDVKYRLGKEEGQVRMDHDPGEKIPVKDGKPVLEAPISGAGRRAVRRHGRPARLRTTAGAVELPQSSVRRVRCAGLWLGQTAARTT